MSTAKHTAGPLSVASETDIYAPGPDGKVLVATCDESNFIPYVEKVANAAFIVRACNSHAELLAACHNALEALEGLAVSNACMSDFERACIPALKAHITKAEGKA